MRRFITDGLRVGAWAIVALGVFLAWRGLPFGPHFAEFIGFDLACFVLPVLGVAGALALGLYRLADRIV